jgi:hypothetical protein
MDQYMTACSATPSPETETAPEHTPAPTPQEHAIANLAQIAQAWVDLQYRIAMGQIR